MSRNWRCEKTEQNQRCKEAYENVTTKPTRTKATANTTPHDQNTMTKKRFPLQVYENATSITHLTTKSFTGSIRIQGGSTPTTSHGGNVAKSPAHDDSGRAIPTTKRANVQEGHGAASLGPVLGGVVSVIVIISAFVLVTSKKGIREYFSRTTKPETAGEIS